MLGSSNRCGIRDTGQIFIGKRCWIRKGCQLPFFRIAIKLSCVGICADDTVSILSEHALFKLCWGKHLLALMDSDPVLDGCPSRVCRMCPAVV